jgi:hypothetical protein
MGPGRRLFDAAEERIAQSGKNQNVQSANRVKLLSVVNVCVTRLTSGMDSTLNPDPYKPKGPTSASIPTFPDNVSTGVAGHWFSLYFIEALFLDVYSPGQTRDKKPLVASLIVTQTDYVAPPCSTFAVYVALKKWDFLPFA